LAAPRFPILVLDVSEDLADVASSELFALGATGIEVRDATTLVRGERGKETLVASFNSEEEAVAALAQLPPEWKARKSEIVGDAWRDEYKKYFRPFLFCRGIVVRPPWEAYEPKKGECVLVLEPGRAFGTGLHETTSLVADVLADHAAELRGKTVLDVGTGSGILALAALLLGASSVRAIDVDPDAVQVAKENADRNGLLMRLCADLTPVGQLKQRFGIVLANIEAGVLAPLADDLHARGEPGALVVLSGILAPPQSTQVSEVMRAYARFEHVETRTRGEWAALVFRARQSA
jgi:ribosomal protein L11 methyltransferase